MLFVYEYTAFVDVIYNTPFGPTAVALNVGCAPLVGSKGVHNTAGFPQYIVNPPIEFVTDDVLL